MVELVSVWVSTWQNSVPYSSVGGKALPFIWGRRLSGGTQHTRKWLPLSLTSSSNISAANISAAKIPTKS